jgi:fumarate reductase subunit D
VRNHPSYWAFLVHRVSGLALAVFLPLHFSVLSSAMQGAGALDSWLDLTRQPLVKLAEWGIVVLLAAHFAGGLRLLALEFLPWRDAQKTLVAVAAAITLAVGLAYGLAL